LLGAWLACDHHHEKRRAHSALLKLFAGRRNSRSTN